MNMAKVVFNEGDNRPHVSLRGTDVRFGYHYSPVQVLKLTAETETPGTTDVVVLQGESEKWQYQCYAAVPLVND